MLETATVKIFLVKGNPDALRTAEISNWTGKGIAGPRADLDEILERDEAKKPGVYFLAGVNPDTGRDRVYIGEAEVIRNRIKQHIERDFWRSLSFFISKDENLTKAHTKYLEGKLIQKAKNANRYELENSNLGGTSLPESDEADMQVFLTKIEQLLPVLGNSFLKPVVPVTAPEQESSMLFCEIRDVQAKGKPTENGFVVMKGSEATLQERPSAKKYGYASNLREELKEEGVLVEQDGKLVFSADHEFSSPSAAAAVVHGGNANGLKAWKNASGVTLKQIEEKGVSFKEA